MSMACLYAVVAYGEDRAALALLLEKALDEVDRIDRLMSHYRADSALSRLNRDAARGPVALDSELFDFIVTAIGYSADSGGAFDITVGPLMKAWGFFGGEGHLPAPGGLARARAVTGYTRLRIDTDQRTIEFDRPGVEIDLGGIAKGYAVDRAVQVLRRGGVTAALVSAGGSTVYGLGAPPGRADWEIEIQDPIAAGRMAFRIALRDRALSIAGTSERWFEADGVRYSHIMDPRTGRPALGVLSVVVVSDTGLEGDALDDALFVQGAGAAPTLLARYERSEAYFLLPAGQHAWRTVHVAAPRSGADRETASPPDRTRM